MASSQTQPTKDVPAEPPLVRAVVARGRTVMTGGRVVRRGGWFNKHEDRMVQEIVTVEDQVANGPNSVIELPADEVKRLRALGYLVDEDGGVHYPVIGPTTHHDTTTR